MMKLEVLSSRSVELRRIGILEHTQFSGQDLEIWGYTFDVDLRGTYFSDDGTFDVDDLQTYADVSKRPCDN